MVLVVDQLAPSLLFIPTNGNEGFFKRGELLDVFGSLPHDIARGLVERVVEQAA